MILEKTPPNRSAWLFGLMALMFAYTAAAYLGLNWAKIGGAGSPVWPAAGIGLAGLLIGGVRLWPAIFLGRLLAAALSGSQQPLWADMMIAGGNSLAAAAPALLFQRFPINRQLSDLSSMLRYLVIGAGGGAIIAAMMGAAALTASSGLSAVEARDIFIAWATGSFTGTLTTGPLIQSWRWRAVPQPALYFTLILLATGAVSWVVFSQDSPYLRTWHVLPLLVWGALTFQTRGAAACFFILAIFSIWGTAHGGLSFSNNSLPMHDRQMVLGQFLGLTGITVLLLGAVDQERQRRSQAQLRLAMHAAGMGGFSYDIEKDSAILDSQSRRLIAVDNSKINISMRDMHEQIHPDDRDFTARTFNAALDPSGSGILSVEYRLASPDEESRWVSIAGETTFVGRGATRKPSMLRAVVRDVTTEKHAAERIRESEKFLRRVLDNLFAFVGVLELDGTLIQANRAPLEAAGLSADAVLGKKFWDCFWWNFSPESRARLREAVERAAAGDRSRYDVEIRIADNQMMWIDFQLAPLRDESGRITHLIPSGMDLTARKGVEEKHAFLLRELSHRVKNTLAIVQSIARQSLRRNPDPEGFGKSFQGRIASLAASHALLTETQWRGATIHEVIDSQLMPIAPDDIKSISIDGPEVTLGAEPATKLGMVLHELGANAVKHGALSSDTGQVKIEWASSNGEVSIKWIERGGPGLENSNIEPGFGAALIEASVHNIVRKFDREGLTVEFTLPLSDPPGT